MKLILASTVLAAIGYAQAPPPCPPLCPKGGDRHEKMKTVKQQKPKAATQTQQAK